MRSSTLQEVAVVRVKKFSSMCFCCVNVPTVYTPNYQNKTASKGLVLNSNTLQSRFSKGSNVTDIHGKGQRAPRGFFSCCTKINTKNKFKKRLLRQWRYDGWITTALITKSNQSRLRRWSLDTLTPDVRSISSSNSESWSKPHITDGRALQPKHSGENSEAIYSFSAWFAPYWIMKVAAVDFCLL